MPGPNTTSHSFRVGQSRRGLLTKKRCSPLPTWKTQTCSGRYGEPRDNAFTFQMGPSMPSSVTVTPQHRGEWSVREEDDSWEALSETWLAVSTKLGLPTVSGLHPSGSAVMEPPERRQAEQTQGGRERKNGAGLGQSVISLPAPFLRL